MVGFMESEMKKISGYYTSTDLTERFKITKMTLSRWIKRENNPLPKPRLCGAGSSNRWAIEDIEEWENKMWLIAKTSKL